MEFDPSSPGRFLALITGSELNTQLIGLRPGDALGKLGYYGEHLLQNLHPALLVLAAATPPKAKPRAVAAKPDSGYIVDSLAWAYFQLGRYQDAVEPMEKASLLEPVDPVVTDHLGDVYWKVGRKREAEFQWHRALSFSPTEADAARIRQKLEKGLDAVLEAEAAGPAADKALTDGN